MPLTPVALALVLAAFAAGAGQQQPAAAPAPAPADRISPAQLKASVDLLGSIDFPVRMEAARTVRRADAATAVPALLDAVANHKDWYVRFRALVILSGFNDPRAGQTMSALLGDKNDRLRAVAYEWFEYHPDAAVLPRLLNAATSEESEFVRPGLTRALAANATTPKAREVMNGLVMSGQDIFRAAVIEAIGEHKGAYALPSITRVAKLEGPLQDDAVLALGRIGDKSALATLADLQQGAPRQLQPSIAAAICLLGSNCGSHLGYIVDTVKFSIANPGYQELLRAAAGGLAALAVAGNKDAAAALFDLGAPTRDPERAAIALAIGTVALRNAPLLLDVLAARSDLNASIELLREAFDMLEEDFEEERFYVTVRRAYWAAPAGAPARRIADTLIQRLEF